MFLRKEVEMAVDVPPLPPNVPAIVEPATPSEASPDGRTIWPFGMKFRERMTPQLAQHTSTSTPRTADFTNGGDVTNDPADGDTD